MKANSTPELSEAYSDLKVKYFDLKKNIAELLKENQQLRKENIKLETARQMTEEIVTEKNVQLSQKIKSIRSENHKIISAPRGKIKNMGKLYAKYKQLLQHLKINKVSIPAHFEDVEDLI